MTCCNNVRLGRRNKAENEGPSAASDGFIDDPPPGPGSALKQQRARLTEHVYGDRSLLCPEYGGSMRIIAFIVRRKVIEKILAHLGLWPAQVHSPPEPIAA